MSGLGRHEYSISNDAEEGFESDIEIKYGSLEWKLWKVMLEEDMRNLKKRVSALERNGKDEPERKVELKHTESFATAGEDGLAGLRTCAFLIRSKKAALLQCIWLTIVIVTLATVGIIEFLRASDNMRSEFKPEKKFQTVDYRDSQSDKQYEMPYIYLYFMCFTQSQFANPDLQWSHEEINETLAYLLETQNYFENTAEITYMDEDLNIENRALPTVEAEAFYEEAWMFGQMFLGYFRLKLADPDPSLGSFQYLISINTEALTRGWTLWVDGFYVSVAREMSVMNWEKTIHVSIDKAIARGSKIRATVDYDERVVRTWQNGYINYFTSSLGWYYEEENDNYTADREPGELELTFRGNLMIDYWEEYVAYGYYDWLSGMGGMLSISSIIFFWVAYYLAVIFGEKNTMGILPGISFVFSNLETIQVVKERVPVDISQ